MFRFCLLLWKHSIILKMVSKAASNLCSNFPSMSLVDFFPEYIHSRLSEQLLETKPELSSLKRVTERIFTISKCAFIEATRNFIMDFLHKKTAINCENHKSSFKKYCFDFRKNIHLTTLPCA
jgi:hypothetical protein